MNDPISHETSNEVSNEKFSRGAGTGKRVRRRRSWYRRRLRMRRILLAVLVGTVVASAAWQNAARHFSLPALNASQILPDSFWGRSNVHKDIAFAVARSTRPARFHGRIPGVYPYSVVPGGIRDAAELRQAAARDYAIRRHYARFNFDRARMLRATEAREVYLSYRIRDTVFWTRNRVRLHVGELLLTDGNITARARCGNQISDVAMPDVSSEEPDVDVFDQPVAGPEPILSAAIHPMLAPPDLPGGVPTPPMLYAGAFIFPYVPVSLPNISGPCAPNDQVVDGKCKPKHKPVAPEPPTMMLIMSGLALIVWRYRRTLRPVAA